MKYYPILGSNYKAFRVVFLKIYAAHKEIYATAGRSGRAKYQLCRGRWEILKMNSSDSFCAQTPMFAIQIPMEDPIKQADNAIYQDIFSSSKETRRDNTKVIE